MSLYLKNWLALSTGEQRTALAKLAGTSLGYLYQLAGGQRSASADVAGRLEEAADLLRAREQSPGPLPRYRVAKSCATCPYAMKCLAEQKEQGKK